MVAAKQSPTYLMNRMMSGNLDRMLGTLDEEIVCHAHEMLGRIMRVMFMTCDHYDDYTEMKTKRQYLYGLVPPEQSTAYYRGVCREFLYFLL